MSKLIYAHTPLQPSPPFLNVTEQDDGAVVVTVRHPGTPAGTGQVAAIRLSREDWDKFKQEVARS